MTSDPPASPDRVADAVDDAARTLPSDDPTSHVFFERRVDVRLTLGSSGHRELVTTQTQGGVTSGRKSIHASEPDFLGRPSLPGEAGGPAQTAAQQDHRDWVAGLEAGLRWVASAAFRGRAEALWTVKLVSFLQEVWVGRPGRTGAHDLRRGCRLELRVQTTGRQEGQAVVEQVIQPDGSPAWRDLFSQALERIDARRSLSGPPANREMTAVFAPGAAGVVAHELIGHALEGDVLAQGPTWLAGGRLDSASPVTVIDDPRRSRGAWSIDDEGTAARATVLINDRRVVGKLLDRASARVLGGESTGHGRRSSYLEELRPRMGCTYIEAGTDDPEEILRSTRRGVFIRRLAAGQTDPHTGRASFVVTDSDLIVAGRIADPLRLYFIEVNGRGAWQSIDRIGHDLAFDTCIGSCVRDGQPLAVSVGAPTIRLGVVTLHS